MSRVGKKPIKVPAGVKVELKGKHLTITGSKETLSLDIVPSIQVAYNAGDSEIVVTRASDEPQERAIHGTTRALIANMLDGVVKGYKKDMAIFGTGYNAKIQGNELILQVGFARPVHFPIPKGVKVDITTPNTRGNDVPALFSISGADKCIVGNFAASIRSKKPPEPYKGKGIRYASEVVKKKVGKAFGSA
jgi:large subunit ribosomal protein L6